MKTEVGHGLRIWTFLIQASIPIVLIYASVLLFLFSIFFVLGFSFSVSGFLKLSEASFLDWFGGQPLWAVVESALVMAFAGVLFVFGVLEMISLVFLNQKTILNFMPRIDKNLGHFYEGAQVSLEPVDTDLEDKLVSEPGEIALEAKETNTSSPSKWIALKNFLNFGLLFGAALMPLVLLAGFLSRIKALRRMIPKEEIVVQMGGLLKFGGGFVGLVLVAMLINILFMEVHPKGRSIHDLMFGVRKVFEK